MHKQLSIHSDSLDSSSVQPIAKLGARNMPYLWLASLALGPLLLLALRLFPALDLPLLHNALTHVVIVLSASILGVILALLVLQVAQRKHDARVFLVGMGFLSIASVFVTHAIATPSVLMSGRGFATSFSAPLSLMLGSLFFALSGLSLSIRANQIIMRRARFWVIIYFLTWLTYNWIVLLVIPGGTTTISNNTAVVAAASSTVVPTGANADEYQDHYAGKGDEYDLELPSDAAAEHQDHYAGKGDEYDLELPSDAVIVTQAPAPPAAFNSQLAGLNRVRIWILIIALGCYGFASYRQYLFYRRLPSQVGFALAAGIALFGEALLTQYLAQVYAISFWLYHIQEFVGFGAISYAMLIGYRRGKDDESLLESVFLASTRARMQASYAKAMDALIAMLSQAEQPTPATREALRARFDLTESQLQVIEGAALAVARERRQRQELEHLNQALRELEEYKRQVTQMVVHDLKNPLTALTGYLEILSSSHLDLNQQDLVQGALRSSKNLSGLIGDLLDVGQIEEGRFDLEYSTFAIGDLLQNCADELQGWLLQESKRIDVETPLEPLMVNADQRLIRRVVLNLLSNAIKHTPPRTQITLRAINSTVLAVPGTAEQLLSRQVIIEVEDTGSGIPADQLEHIFERFGRYQRSTPNDRQTSTGLGLTFCRLVVEAHGGSMSVSSVVGSGTTFRVMLPCR
jgi:signal transduction histidine kinase